jgi:hypothetical protein
MNTSFLKGRHVDCRNLGGGPARAKLLMRHGVAAVRL